MYGQAPYDYGRDYGRDQGRGYGRDQGRPNYEAPRKFPFLAFRLIGFILIGTAVLILVLDIARIALAGELGSTTGAGVSLWYRGGPSIGSFITVVITGAVGAAISPYRRIDTVKSLKIGFLVMTILNCMLFLPSFVGVDAALIGVIYGLYGTQTGIEELDAWLALTASIVALNCLAFILCLAGSIVCCVAFGGPYPEHMMTRKDPYWRDPRYEPHQGNMNYNGYDKQDYQMGTMPPKYPGSPRRDNNYPGSYPRDNYNMPPPPSYKSQPYHLPRANYY